MNFEFPLLQRPQYPASPEVLLSALAWATVARRESTEFDGLLYRRKVANRGRLRIAETFPKPKTEDEEAFLGVLAGNGVGLDGDPPDISLARAVLDAMYGVSPKKGKGIPSSAIGVAGALLQDPTGSLSVKSPPNFANIINTMHALGGSEEGGSAAERWFEAAAYHAGDHILRHIEAAFIQTTLEPHIDRGLDDAWPPSGPNIASSSVASPVPRWWIRDVVNHDVATPFSWFRESWDRLCSPDWYHRLSARRWTSWAICLLRHAFGFGFLWEANFYRAIALGIMTEGSDPADVAHQALIPKLPLIPHPQGSISERDVMPGIKRNLAIGLACRGAVQALASDSSRSNPTLASWIQDIGHRINMEGRDSLSQALSGRGEQGGLKNLQETVRFSLLSRGEAEAGERDNYALLAVASRRFTHISPGPEWVVVMSAVSRPPDGQVVRLGDLLTRLRALGLQPRMDFLLGELERAGLCASAADGDEGIEINLGFGEVAE